MVVGAIGDNDNGNDSGSAYVFTRTGTTWTQQAKLAASDGAALDSFGRSVAIAGDTIVVGASADDDNGTNSGSVYVFTRTGTTWTEQAKLTASDGAVVDQFGFSVDIAGDTIVAGARQGDGNGITSSGSAYVFMRTGTAWTEQAKITASDGAAFDEFGFTVAIAGDTIVVGAYRAANDTVFFSGSAYVYTRTGTTWTQQTKLTASDGAEADNFGQSVAIAGDTIVVGATLDDVNGILNSGSAYVFTRTGTTWAEQAKLIVSDNAPFDNFGTSVAVVGDTIVVGSSGDDNNNGFTDSGSAYVFMRIGTIWTQQTKLIASDANFGDQFGIGVAIDGDTIVAGAFGDNDDGVDSGSAYVYDLN